MRAMAVSPCSGGQAHLRTTQIARALPPGIFSKATANQLDQEDFQFSSALEFIPAWLAYAKVHETPSLVLTSPVLRFTLRLNCSKRRRLRARSSSAQRP